MPRVRVAHVAPTARIAYLLLRRRLQHLQHAGYDVLVVCGEDPYGQRLRDAGLQVIHIPFAREIRPLTDLRCLLALRRVLRAERVQIADSHNPKGTLLGPLAARLARVPLVVHTVHGLLFNDQTRGPGRWAAVAAERWGAAWTHHLLFQSRQDCSWAAAESPDVDWIAITSGTGTGDGTASFTVGANPTGKNRTSKINVAITTDATKKKTFTVNESK